MIYKNQIILWIDWIFVSVNWTKCYIICFVTSNSRHSQAIITKLVPTRGSGKKVERERGKAHTHEIPLKINTSLRTCDISFDYVYFYKCVQITRYGMNKVYYKNRARNGWISFFFSLKHAQKNIQIKMKFKWNVGQFLCIRNLHYGLKSHCLQSRQSAKCKPSNTLLYVLNRSIHTKYRLA